MTFFEKKNDNKWVDVRLGATGNGVWIAPISMLAISYCIYIFSKILVSSQEETVKIIYLVGILILVTLLIADIFFIKESRKTAQQIIFQDDSKCTVHLYFGREISFNSDQIDVIKPHKAGWMHRLMTILDRNRNNYLVSLHGDSFFFISGAMPQVGELITRIKSERKGVGGN